MNNNNNNHSFLNDNNNINNSSLGLVQGLVNDSSIMIDVKQSEADAKQQQQQQINRRAFELLRRLFILQVSERSVTRSFLQKLPSNEVIDRIETVLKKVGASRFMSLDDFHLVLNQALCPQSGAANSALPSASDVLGGLMSPKGTMRNKQKRTSSFTEKQQQQNSSSSTSVIKPGHLLGIPSLDATMNQTYNSMNMTAGQNYRMTAQTSNHAVPLIGVEDDPSSSSGLQPPDGKRKRRLTMSSNILQQQQQQQAMIRFSDKSPEEEDISHITTTESRVLFSLFENNGLVSIQQIKEGLDLLLKGENYALLAYTRKIVCEPDNSEKESIVTVLELEWMPKAVCTYFHEDDELKEHSKKLIESLWREAHQGSVARRTFRLAILEDQLLHRAVQILPRFGSNDDFALRPETREPLNADPMQMMNVTYEMVMSSNNNSQQHDASLLLGASQSVHQNLNGNARNNNNQDGASSSSAPPSTGRGLAFETLDLYDPHFKGDQFINKDPTKQREENTKEAGDPQFFSLRGQPYISVFGGPPQPIFDVRS